MCIKVKQPHPVISMMSLLLLVYSEWFAFFPIRCNSKDEQVSAASKASIIIVKSPTIICE